MQLQAILANVVMLLVATGAIHLVRVLSPECG
jgi:hypothetical protein